MKTAVYSTHGFEKDFLVCANAGSHELVFLEARLTSQTARLAAGCEAVCVFVSDELSVPVLEILQELGVRYIVLRSAGFNHVNLKKAGELDLGVARVPEYSPFAVGEYAVTMMLALNRKIIQANRRITEQNFSLDGLVGFDMHGKTVGIAGTGKIGAVVARILHGFGCNILAYDKVEAPELQALGARYLSFEDVCRESDIITLHVPLHESTRYMVNAESISWMKRGVMLINTGRGGLINTRDVIAALKSGHIGALGLDVYEEEEGLFFEDHSEDILQDEVIVRLMSFRNVLITSHQAFLTGTALENIAAATIHNIDCFEKGLISGNEVKV
ncbi:MAG: 2-hydroxyacid dehydrogenase [Sphingobacteriales bacterium]|nr:MAG: 2-hydroxyacid dehydrogenase [Sphingobacteriales bacterium]